jgi:tetratricopeptide (TPR) repeat protein
MFWRAPRSSRLFAIPLALLSFEIAHAHPGTDVAIADLTALIATAPASAELHIRRALCYVEHARWSDAESDLSLAAQLEPTHAGLPLARAEYYLARRDFPAAIRTLNPVLQAQPNDPAARILRARAFALNRDDRSALADFRVALANLPEPKPDLWLEANALIAIPSDALADLDAGIARIGAAPALVEKAFTLEVQLHRNDDALARLAQLTATAERPELFLKRRGDLLTSLGRPVEARTAYTAALTALDHLPDWLRASEPTRQLSAQLTALLVPST